VRRAVLLALLGGWLLAGVVTAGPASAHASLVTTDPGEGARVAEVPSAVTLQFSEGVSLGAGYARVLGSHGQRVDAGTASVDGDVLTIPLRTGLPDDGYLVTYRVISADSHPVAGAYSFVVGNGSLVPTGAAGSQDRTDPVIGAGLPVTRWIGYAGLALAFGVPLLVLLCWPAGWTSVRLGRMATWGAVAVAVGALGSFLLQGPYAAGSGPGSLLDPSLLRATLGSEAGKALLVRVVLALGLAVVLWRAWRRGDAPSTGSVVVGALLATGVVVSTAAIGHPVAGSWPGLAIPVTVVHVAAMAAWLGGLAGLLAGVLLPGVPADDVADAVSRYSRLAFTAVVALVVSGTVQAVREVESPTALFATAYGWVLVAKLVLVVVALAAAGVSRVWVQQRLGVRRSRPRGRRSLTAHAFAASADDGVAAAAQARRHLQSENALEHVPELRRSVLVEAAVAAVVLALSAVLVGLPPARAAVAQPVDAVLPLQSAAGPSGSVQVSVDPARPGANTLHLYLFDDSGQLVQPAGITVTLTEASQQIGPLAVKLQPGGPGHYIADGMDIPGAGTWTLTVTVRVDEFTATTASTDFPVR
jgi:copper transport protein